jgi:hypothetical protein
LVLSIAFGLSDGPVTGLIAAGVGIVLWAFISLMAHFG